MKYRFFLALTALFFTNIFAFATTPDNKGVEFSPDTTKKLELYDNDFFSYEDDELDEDSLEILPAELMPFRTPIDSIQDFDIDLSGFVFPTASSHITSPFGPRRGRFHYGTDIGLSYGDTVVAAFDGVIRVVNYQRKGYGHYVIIRHKDSLETVYAHFTRPLVEVNQEVKAGDPIGLGGSTGRSTGPHLHFEMRYLGNAFNSTKVINYASKDLYTNTYRVNKTATFSHKKEIDQLKAARYHKVKSGETLSHIARRYGTSVAQLCKLNKIKPTTILQIGRTIRYR